MDISSTSLNRIFYKYSYSSKVHTIHFYGNDIPVVEIVRRLTPRMNKIQLKKYNTKIRVYCGESELKEGERVRKNSSVVIKRFPLNSPVASELSMLCSKDGEGKREIEVNREEIRYEKTLLPSGHVLMKKSRKTENGRKYSSEMGLFYQDKSDGIVKKVPSEMCCRACGNLNQDPHLMRCCGMSYCYCCIYFMVDSGTLNCDICHVPSLFSDVERNWSLEDRVRRFLEKNVAKEEAGKKKRFISRRRNHSRYRRKSNSCCYSYGRSSSYFEKKYSEDVFYVKNNNKENGTGIKRHHYLNNNNNNNNNKHISNLLQHQDNISGMKRKRDHYEYFIDQETLMPIRKKRKV